MVENKTDVEVMEAIAKKLNVKLEVVKETLTEVLNDKTFQKMPKDVQDSKLWKFVMTKTSAKCKASVRQYEFHAISKYEKFREITKKKDGSKTFLSTILGIAKDQIESKYRFAIMTIWGNEEKAQQMWGTIEEGKVYQFYSGYAKDSICLNLTPMNVPDLKSDKSDWTDKLEKGELEYIDADNDKLLYNVSKNDYDIKVVRGSVSEVQLKTYKSTGGKYIAMTVNQSKFDINDLFSQEENKVAVKPIYVNVSVEDGEKYAAGSDLLFFSKIETFKRKDGTESPTLRYPKIVPIDALYSVEHSDVDYEEQFKEEPVADNLTPVTETKKATEEKKEESWDFGS